MKENYELQNLLTDGWQVNEWVKKAVVLYFPIQKMETLEAGIFEYHDKIPLKTGYAAKGIRVVPNALHDMVLIFLLVLF